MISGSSGPLTTAAEQLKLKLVLMDIDGVIVDSSYRQPHFDTDFDRYLELHHTDQPITAGVFLTKMFLKQPDIRVVFITSRTDLQRDTTLLLLKKLFGPSAYELWMRTEGDTAPCAEVKLKLLLENKVHPNDVLIAFDDLPSNIAMYREIGIVVYQAPFEES